VAKLTLSPLGSVAQKDALGVDKLGHGLSSGPGGTEPPHHPQPAITTAGAQPAGSFACVGMAVRSAAETSPAV
jgi:hypothetical protein